jgi:tripartite-type tricarboxylate transporter receptor subunit TctC
MNTRVLKSSSIIPPLLGTYSFEACSMTARLCPDIAPASGIARQQHRFSLCRPQLWLQSAHKHSHVRTSKSTTGCIGIVDSMELSKRMLLASLSTAFVAPRVAAEQWPTHPVSWIVPYPAGGGSDTFARPVAAQLAERLGQPMLIDNRAGAAGTLGTAVAARAASDGYTLLVADTGLTYEPVIYSDAGYDFARDFAAISAIARAPYLLVVNPRRLDVATLAAFIASARQRPDAINIGSAGQGSVSHLAIDLLQSQAGIKLTHVPYRGGTPMLQDLVAGHIDAGFVLAGAVASHVQSGPLRALVVANRRREPLLPAVPAAQEAGLPNLRATVWFGLFAPRPTETAILDRLRNAVQAALATPDLQRRWAELGARVEPESRADFARFVVRDTERWTRIARAANIRIE